MTATNQNLFAGWMAPRELEKSGISKWERWISPILFLVSVACYANTLLNGFVYDDELQILANPYVKSWHYLPQIFTTTVWSFIGAAGDSNYYRPLMTFTYLLLWKAFGDLPFGYHLFNILLNALVVVAVYSAGQQLFKSRSFALVAALLFALHPIHTESVNWIAAVPDLEATLLFVAAFLIYIRRPILDSKSHVAVVACYVTAMMAKEPALLLAPLLVYYEHFVRDGRQQTPFRAKIRQYAPVCLAGLGYLVLRSLLFGKLAPVLQHPQITWREAIYSAFALIASYARLLFWPTRLSAFHTFHASESLRDPGVLAGMAMVLGCLAFIVYFYKRQPQLAFCVLWIGLTLGPVLNVRWMAANVLTERYLYLPSVAFCWLAGRIAERAWDLRLENQRGRALLRVILCIAGIVLAAMGATRIWARNRIWHDDMALYSRTLETDPDSYVMHMNMGVSYFAAGNFAAAEKELRRALELKPDSANVLNALGCVYLEEGRPEEASKTFQSAIAFKPRWSDSHFNYGRLLKKTGQNDAALAEFQTAVEVGPLNGTARLYLAQELAERGQDSEAEAEYRSSIQLSASLMAQRNLADILLKTGREDAAVAMLQQIAKEYPFDSSTHVKLGRLLEKEGKPAEAGKEYQATLVTDPANAEAQAALKRLKSLGK
ncbi:MAG TPA: tetratricopeptide repeat protein [Candidatus Acidoferrales bacterium]|jgi:Flp pilus assembly protein TadD|nr:tetratricopeptide repeat protein [Candidatus Acidoferrales bacterium]